MKLESGKIPHGILEALLERIPRKDPRVLIGSQIGADAAALEMGEEVLIATTDPITFTTGRIGWYAVHVNANDVAVMGAIPRWLLVTILMPEGASQLSGVEEIFAELETACERERISLIGGHTEVTSAVTRPVVVGQMMGVTTREKLVDGRNLAPGDVIVQVGAAATEGTSILARELEGKLQGLVAGSVLESARGFLDVPGISVAKAARIVCETVHPKAMHDATEGGLATALCEMGALGSVSLRIQEERILIHPETRAICQALSLDPLGLLASGTLLVGLLPEEVPLVLEALGRGGILAGVVGTARPAGPAPVLAGVSGERSLPLYARDELLRAFD